MIVLNLCCDSNHVFEGWFVSAGIFELQRASGKLVCPVCGSAGIVRRPSAPYVQRGGERAGEKAGEKGGEGAGEKGEPQQPAAGLPAAMQAAILKLAREMARGAENVGEAFPDEARKIHYGEVEERNIRGVASRDEANALLEEGILVVPVPWPGDDTLH